MHLIQQIAKIRVEMQRRQDLPPPGFTTNASTDERPPMYFSLFKHGTSLEPMFNSCSESLSSRLNHAKSLIHLSLLPNPTPLRIIILKWHIYLKMPITNQLHLHKNKTQSIPKHPSITKINTLIPNHTLKTTKPVKTPQVHP